MVIAFQKFLGEPSVYAGVLLHHFPLKWSEVFLSISVGLMGKIRLDFNRNFLESSKVKTPYPLGASGHRAWDLAAVSGADLVSILGGSWD